jgi:hypothetical protein
MSDTSVFGFVIFLVLGLATAGFGGYMWTEQSERINSYETTEATVLSSEVEEDVRNDPDGGTERRYYPDVTYEYTVDGETYENSNVMPGPGRSSSGQNRAQNIVENHPEGETVTVHYDPENPSNSFLVENRQLIFLGVAGFGGLISVLVTVQLVRRVAGLAM